MTASNHYAVLGVAPSSSIEEIRAAYRRLAREHHPDRVAAVGGDERSMPEINEAYRVLSDPARRAVYDASRRPAGTVAPPVAATSAAEPGFHRSARAAQSESFHATPARVPWRSLLFFGTLAIIGIVVVAQFSEAPSPPGPDGIVRVGECVTIDAQGFARDATCAGQEGVDLVVEALVPFGADCPGRTVAHQDRQGMGIVCVVEAAEFTD